MIKKLKVLGLVTPLLFSGVQALAWQDVMRFDCSKATSIGEILSDEAETTVIGAPAAIKISNDLPADLIAEKNIIVSEIVREATKQERDQDNRESKLKSAEGYDVKIYGYVISTGLTEDPQSASKLTGYILNMTINKNGKVIYNNAGKRLNIHGESGQRVSEKRFINFKHPQLSINGFIDTSNIYQQNVNLFMPASKKLKLNEPVALPLNCSIEMKSSLQADSK